MIPSQKSSVALLIFTRTPHEEALNKNFTEGSFRQQELISNRLIRNTIGMARKSGLPYFIIYSNQQHGHSFGERFSNAVAEIFEKGFANVIAIGNDAPGLSPESLKTAARQLKQKELVLGPDRRGGAYLIGISKNIFSKEAFSSFKWNSPALLEEMIQWGEQHVSLLPRLLDINSSADFNSIVRERKISFSLLHELKGILASGIQNTKYFFHTPFFETLRLPQHRGPPSIA